MQMVDPVDMLKAPFHSVCPPIFRVDIHEHRLPGLMRLAWTTIMCSNSPDMNSLGISFLPDVVTRYSVKFSMRSTTHEVINLLKLSRICLVEAACAKLLWLTFELLSLVGMVLVCGDVRSNGWCVGARFGWHKSNRLSRKANRDCSSHNAGGIAASLYL